jgi:histone deacetylase complex regulatory component SIN3
MNNTRRRANTAGPSTSRRRSPSPRRQRVRVTPEEVSAMLQMALTVNARLYFPLLQIFKKLEAPNSNVQNACNEGRALLRNHPYLLQTFESLLPNKTARVPVSPSYRVPAPRFGHLRITEEEVWSLLQQAQAKNARLYLELFKTFEKLEALNANIANTFDYGRALLRQHPALLRAFNALSPNKRTIATKRRASNNNAGPSTRRRRSPSRSQ